MARTLSETELSEIVLRRMREDKTSNSKLGREVGLSDPYISKVRLGQRPVPQKKLLTFCDHYGLDPKTGKEIDKPGRYETEEQSIETELIPESQPAAMIEEYLSREAIPTPFRLTPTEARYILARRDKHEPYRGLNEALEGLRLTLAGLPQSDFETRGYVRAAMNVLETALNALEAKKTIKRGKTHGK
jgi:hypothetical protein